MYEQKGLEHQRLERVHRVEIGNVDIGTDTYRVEIVGKEHVCSFFIL